MWGIFFTDSHDPKINVSFLYPKNEILKEIFEQKTVPIRVEFWIETILAMGDAQWDKVKPYSVQKKLERNKIHPFHSKIWSVTLENYKNNLWCNIL